jgi:hypothetical protein
MRTSEYSEPPTFWNAPRGPTGDETHLDLTRVVDEWQAFNAKSMTSKRLTKWKTLADGRNHALFTRWKNSRGKRN